MPRKILSIGRMAGVSLALAFYVGRLMCLSLIFGRDEKRGFRYRRKFTRSALRILGIKITLRGSPSASPALYVSNHRSLVDPFIQLSVIDAYIVSKAEVETYPLVGRGAKETGVIFVKRQESNSRAAAKQAIRDALCSGKSVLIYPEGTTSNLDTTQEFKMGAFQVAAEESIPVIPVAVDYANPEDYWFAMPMFPFFLKKFSKLQTRAAVSIGNPMESDDALRLMKTSREWIGHEIRLLHSTLNGH